MFDDFGVADSVFHEEHQLHPHYSFGVDFTYMIPDISDVSLELCELLVDGESVGIYTSIEEAFAEMIDPSKEYEVRLGYYSFYIGAPEYTIDLTELPRVKKIKITGVNDPAEEGYLDKNTLVKLAGNVNLNCHLELCNVEFEGDGVIRLNSNELTLSGRTVYLNTKVIGITDSSTVNVKAEQGVYFFEGIEVYKLLAGDKKVVFGADSHVVYMQGTQIYLSGNPDVKIDNRIK